MSVAVGSTRRLDPQLTISPEPQNHLHSFYYLLLSESSSSPSSEDKSVPLSPHCSLTGPDSTSSGSFHSTWLGELAMRGSTGQ